MVSKWFTYVLRGLVLIGPLALTFFVLYKSIVFFDGLVTQHIPQLNFPGLGILILLIALTLLGWLGGTILAQPFIKYFNKLIAKAPMIKMVYNSIKDVFNALIGQQKKFSKPVMVKMNESAELYKLGYVTEEDLSDLKLNDDQMVAVYLPHSYNFSGNLYLTPRKNLTHIDYPSANFMKFVVSGGVTSLKSEV